MWPLEHLAVGYLLYSAYAHLRHGRPPRTPAVAVVLVATQLPDLIDKPLAWVVGALPSGHALAHSLLFAVPVAALVALDGRLHGGDWAGPAFATGYLSHLFADAAVTVVLADWSEALFLVWPLAPAQLTADAPLLVVVRHLFGWYLGLFTGPGGELLLAFDAALFGAALLVWSRDGRPGVDAVTARVPALGAR